MSGKPKPSAVVFAKNVVVLAEFYQSVGAMRTVHADADHIVLDEGSFQIVVHAIPERIAKQIVITRPPEIRRETPLKLCIPVASIAQARVCAAELGGLVGAEGEEWESREFRACDGHDPEGNVFQVRHSTV